jgi:hypothetical protein
MESLTRQPLLKVTNGVHQSRRQTEWKTAIQYIGALSNG